MLVGQTFHATTLLSLGDMIQSIEEDRTETLSPHCPHTLQSYITWTFEKICWHDVQETTLKSLEFEKTTSELHE